jgi:hypothetical protein
MDKYKHFDAGRYAWGALHNSFAMIFSQWKWLAAALVMLAIASGYMIQWIGFSLIIVFAAISGRQTPPAYSNMLIVGGRRERFLSSVVLGVVTVTSICAAVLIMTGMSRILAGFMPDIVLKGGAVRLSFRIIDARFVFIPLVAAPFVLTIRLVSYRRPGYFVLLFALLMFPMMLAIMLPPGTCLREDIMAIFTDRGSVAGIVIGGWAVFILVLCHICYERCLVGQGRSL